MMVGLVLVCSRVLPENTFIQCFPDNVHTCPRTFLDGDSTCGRFRFHHKVTYGEGYRGHCKSPSDGGRHTKNLKSGPLRARGLRDLLQAGVNRASEASKVEAALAFMNKQTTKTEYPLTVLATPPLQKSMETRLDRA